MPSIRKSKKIQIRHPIVTRILIVGSKTTIIEIKEPEEVDDKSRRAFCVITLAEYYAENINNYSDIDDFMKLFLGTNACIELDTNKGNILGLKVNAYFLKQMRDSIIGLLLMNSVRDGTLKI